MDMKKLAPWNWFKKEHESLDKTVPVKRDETSSGVARVPDHPLHRFHQEVDRLFEDAFRGFGLGDGLTASLWPAAEQGLFKPRLDLGATENAYSISVEIPGVEAEDIRVDITSDTLTIQGEKKQINEEKDRHYYRLERSYGSFQRILSLPEDADRENITASFKNGILQVHIPRKSLPAPDVRQIEIQSDG
ncbi:MAG: Hsp20/alpha crystallin family protein [Thermodesulfobacteriota bacterium]